MFVYISVYIYIDSYIHIIHLHDQNLISQVVSIRNVEDGLKGIHIAVFKMTTKLQINCIIYNIRIVRSTLGEKYEHLPRKLWWRHPRKMIVQLIDVVVDIRHISLFATHFQPHIHRQNTRLHFKQNILSIQKILTLSLFRIKQYFVCNMCGILMAQNKTYHPQLERRLLRQYDCKVTICRENYWNTKNWTYGCKYNIL